MCVGKKNYRVRLRAHVRTYVQAAGQSERVTHVRATCIILARLATTNGPPQHIKETLTVHAAGDADSKQDGVCLHACVGSISSPIVSCRDYCVVCPFDPVAVGINSLYLQKCSEEIGLASVSLAVQFVALYIAGI